MKTRCDGCGAESALEENFQKTYRSFRPGFRTLCPRCWSEANRKSLGSARRVMLSMMLAGMLVILFLKGGRGAALFLSNLAILYALMVAITLVHELAHALTARLLGWRVFAVIIGRGRTMFEVNLSGCSLELRAFTGAGGLTIAAPLTVKRMRIDYFIIVLAGPAVNLILAAALLSYLGLDEAFRWGLASSPRPLSLLFVGNLLAFVGNLVPLHFDTDFGRLPSDGLTLLKLLSGRGFDPEGMLVARYLMEAMRCRERRDLESARRWLEEGLKRFPGNPYLLLLRGVNCIDRGRPGQAREICRGLLEQPDLEPAWRGLALNHLAEADIASGDAELLDEADRCSEEALRCLPWNPGIQATRGAVLAARGDAEKGLALLRAALEKIEAPRDRALAACLLGRAETRRGNVEEGRRCFEIARKLDPACVLLKGSFD